MNERWRPSRLLAGLFAFIAFIGSFTTLALMGATGGLLPGFAHPKPDADQAAESFGILVASISAILGLAFGVFVYRAVRHRISREIIFHACIFIGLTLLGWCLWAVFAQYPILNSRSLITDWSGHVVQPAFSGSVICLFVIPVALLFLVFAVFHDNNRNT